MSQGRRVSAEQVARDFEAYMGEPPLLVARGPGRVNLIGEHTDYNEGFVFPVAIERAAYVAATPRDDRKLRMWATQFQEEFVLDLDQAEPQNAISWGIYVLGMAAMIEKDGHRLRGANLVIDGDVPTGAGLSSSAALENAVGVALATLAGVSIPPVRMAQIGRRTENEFVGVQSGIMDQMISAMGQAYHALLIDCRTYTYDPIPMPENVRIVVCDSKVSRELASSAYNVRRAECEEAVSILSSVLPGITALRDVTTEQLAEYEALLPPVVFQRARHVVTENARTVEGAERLRAGDAARFGELMNASHASLRDDYAVSSPQLDLLVSTAQSVPGVYGSRLTGAGFGGCTVALTTPEAVEELTATVSSAYEAAYGVTPNIYVSQASDGARVVLGNDVV